MLKLLYITMISLLKLQYMATFSLHLGKVLKPLYNQADDLHETPSLIFSEDQKVNKQLKVNK